MDLKPLRKAIEEAGAGFVDPFTDASRPISRALNDAMAQPSISNSAIMGYRSRDAEVAALRAERDALRTGIVELCDQEGVAEPWLGQVLRGILNNAAALSTQPAATTSPDPHHRLGQLEGAIATALPFLTGLLNYATLHEGKTEEAAKVIANLKLLLEEKE